MQDLESFKKTFRTMFPNWTEEQVEKKAKFMSEKESTLKKGPNVIHLEYYHGTLLTDDDILEIENNISKAGLELSRFDKMGIAYASLEDFMLQVSISLRDPIVSNIVLGVGSGVLWDTIKGSTFFIWKRIKENFWDQDDKKDSVLNFGINVSLDRNTNLDLKLDGKLSEETVLKAIDKIVDLIKETKRNDSPAPAKFMLYDKNGGWLEVNEDEEIRNKINNSQKSE